MASLTDLPIEILGLIFEYVQDSHGLYAFLLNRRTHGPAIRAMYGDLILNGHRSALMHNPANSTRIQAAFRNTRLMQVRRNLAVSRNIPEAIHNRIDSRLSRGITAFTPNLKSFEFDTGSRNATRFDLVKLPKLRKIVIDGLCDDVTLNIDQSNAIDHLEIAAGRIRVVSAPSLATLSTLILTGPNCFTAIYTMGTNANGAPMLQIPFTNLRNVTIEGFYRVSREHRPDLAWRLWPSRHTLRELTIIERPGRFGVRTGEDGNFARYTQLRKIKVHVSWEPIYPWIDVEGKMLQPRGPAIEEYELQFPLVPINRFSKSASNIRQLVRHLPLPWWMPALRVLKFSVCPEVWQLLQEGRYEELRATELDWSKRWKKQNAPQLHNTMFAMEKLVKLSQQINAENGIVQVDTTELERVIKEEAALIKKEELVRYEDRVKEDDGEEW